MLRSRLLPALTLVVCAPMGFGQVIASESFDYPVGNLGGQNGGTGFADGEYLLRGTPYDEHGILGEPVYYEGSVTIDTDE